MLFFKISIWYTRHEMLQLYWINPMVYTNQHILWLCPGFNIGTVANYLQWTCHLHINYLLIHTLRQKQKGIVFCQLLCFFHSV